METIKRSEVSNLRMTAGNEIKIARVIDRGMVKEWVGIGWVNLGEADGSDYGRYPVLED